MSRCADVNDVRTECFSIFVGCVKRKEGGGSYMNTIMLLTLIFL